MSASAPRAHPSIDAASNVTLPSSAACNSLTGVDTFLPTPSTSANANRTNCTCRSLARRKTSRLPAARRESLAGECIDCNCHSQRKLVVRIVEFAPADLADLPEAVEDRVPVHAQLGGRSFHIFAD